MSLVLLAAGLLYALGVLRLAAGLYRAQRRFVDARARAARDPAPELGVVVAARNEEAGLPALLAALDAQTCEPGRLSITIVDDGSTDATPRILTGFSPRRHRFRSLRLDHDPARGSPKKAALAAGIAATPAPFLLLTDADTVPPPEWAAALGLALAGGCPVVAGYSPPEPRCGLPGRLAGLWDLGTAVLAGGFIGSGRVVHLTGRSWGFSRRLYEAAGGYDGLEHVLSGDDTLLAQKLARHAPPREWGFTLEPALQVPTRPPAGWGPFLADQLRHVATGRRFTPRARLVAAAGFGLFVLFWLALVTLPWRPWGASGPVALLLKLTADTVAFGVGAAAAGETGVIFAAPLFSLLHLLIFPWLQLAGTVLPVRWKGRRGR